MEAKECPVGVINCIPTCCSNRAEISFKAGQLDQAAFDQINFDKERNEFWVKIEEAERSALEEGRREVVEFIGDYTKPFPNQRVWEAKLKEWDL